MTSVRFDVLGPAWLHESLLRRGGPLATGVASSIALHAGETWAVVPPGYISDQLDPSEGGLMGRGEATLALAELLDASGALDDAVLLVEDDAARAGDRSVAGAEFITIPPDRIVHALVTRAPGDAPASAAFISTKGCGFPTNAFVVDGRAADVDRFLRDSTGLVEWCAARLRMVIVAAFDAESWLVWRERPSSSSTGP